MTQDADISFGDGSGMTDGTDAKAPDGFAAQQWTSTRWGDEAREAYNLRRLHTRAGRKRLQKFGQGLREGWQTQLDDYVNFPYLFYQNTRASMIYNNPRFKLSSRSPVADREQVRQASMILNQWSLDSGLSEVATRAWFDITIDGFACVVVGTEQYAGPTLRDVLRFADLDADAQFDANVAMAMDAQPKRPYVENIDPDDVLFDSRAKHWKRAEWAGHTQIMRDEQLEREGVPKNKILMLAKDQTDEHRRQKGEPVTGTDLDRGEYLVMWAWRRETQTIHLLGFKNGSVDSDPIELIDPRPFKGHRDGPYVLMGVVYVRGQLYFMSPLAPTDRINEELDKHRGQIMEDAGSAKRMLFTDSPAINELLQNGLNNSAHCLPGFDANKTKVYEWGGVQQANVDQAARLEDDLQRVGGLSAITQGQVGSSDTATEVAESSSRTDARLAVMQTEFRRGLVDIAERALEYFLSDPEVRAVVPSRVNGAEEDVLFWGGAAESTLRERMSIEVVPYSSEYVSSEAQKLRALGMMQTVQSFVSAVMTTPFGIDWQEIWRLTTEANNWGESAGAIVDVATIIQQAQAAQAMQMMAPGPTAGAASGRQATGPAGADVVSRMRSGASRMGQNAAVMA